MNNTITKLEYEKINNVYSKAKYGGFDVIMNIENGYINATKLCADGGKLMKNWLRNDGNKELVEFFESRGSSHSLKMITIITSGSDKETILRGTYVHPKLIPHIAMWISPAFAYKISCILEEWKKISPDNEERFWNEMGSSFKETKDMNKNEGYESMFRDRIAKEENGIIEVETPVGFIDVLTDSKIIEVKSQHLWKHALGQVKCYGYYYPDKQKYIYLFDCKDMNKDIIDDICNSEGVMVKYIE